MEKFQKSDKSYRMLVKTPEKFQPVKIGLESEIKKFEKHSEIAKKKKESPENRFVWRTSNINVAKIN